MSNRVSHHRNTEPTALRRRLIGLWLALSVLVAGFVPAGYMPSLARAADGSTYLTMVICTADGEQVITIDAEGNQVELDHETPEQPAHAGGADCAFSIISAPALTPADVVIDQPITTADRTDIAAADLIWLSVKKRPGQPRAPPV
ncbi:MAG: DUF2946 family protein [Alphaproteobacteria bacterium]|nr:DUF2946 family protein [Alphaproteobacteria bacterium SS10]